ncbi:MAG: conserved phage C-terminal domain-containing protein [Candidatus Omnitrophota bacterium]
MASPQLENGYTRVANEILEALSRINIPPGARRMLDCIWRKTYGFHQKKARITTGDFIKCTGMCEVSIHRNRAWLLKKGLIFCEQEGKLVDGLIYSFNKDYQKWQGLSEVIRVIKSDKGYQKGVGEVIKSDKGGLSEVITPIVKDTLKDTLKETEDSASSPEKELIREIIADLNAVLGTSYRPESKGTVKHVQARLKEGWQIEDFKTVIRKKKASWGDDPKMAAYLRPETLFGVKFESYLNEKQKLPAVSAGQRFRG